MADLLPDPPEAPIFRVEVSRSPASPALKSRLDAYEKALAPPKADYASKLIDTWATYCENTFGQRTDGWENAVTGHGTTRDKAFYTTFTGDGQLDVATLENLFHNDDMCRKIVSLPVRHMLRRGFTIEAQGWDDETQKAFLESLKVHALIDKLTDAHCWGRLHGGGKIFMGIDDGQDPSKPVNEAGIKAVRFLTVLDRWSLFPNSWQTDPRLPDFGDVETYRVVQFTMGPVLDPQSNQSIIHASRMLHFGGAKTTIRKRRANLGWDDSVLQAIRVPLEQFAMTWAAIGQLILDANQGVYSVKGLFNMIAGKMKEALQDRMTMVDQARSNARMLVVDADSEKFERVTTSFAGLPDIIDRTATRIAAAAEMPATVLFGQSPDGMNASGEGDTRNWYDQLEAERTQEVQPQIERLIKMFLLAKEGPTKGVAPSGWKICFPALWVATEAERADIYTKRATGDCAYIEKGVLLPEEVALGRAEDPDFPEIDVEQREKMLEISTEKAEEDLLNPPELPPIPGQESPPSSGEAPTKKGKKPFPPK